MKESLSLIEQGLQATLKYLEGLPTSTDTSSAVANIEDWEKILRDNGQVEFQYIADELQNLRVLLKAEKLDGKAIGQTMITLGEHTGTAAAHVDPKVADEIQSLGKWLQRVGQGLV